MGYSCGGVIVATALNKLRPLSTPEALAYDVLNNPYKHVESHGQQGFVDQRAAPRDRHTEKQDQNFEYEMASDDDAKSAKSDVFMPDAIAESTTKVPTESIAAESRAEPGSEATESREKMEMSLFPVPTV